jgi:hypothetical protein
MEHVFSMLFARGCEFTTKNNLAKGAIFLQEKKLFVNATFLLALCARPYPLPSAIFAA